MTIEIHKEDFATAAEYHTDTVSYLLEEMQTRLPDNVFLLNKTEVGDTTQYEAPYIRQNDGELESTLGSYLDQVIPETDGKKEFTIASVINVQGNHYISAIFREDNGVKTLVIHDPLGDSGKTKGYDNYADQIEKDFKTKFGEGITVEINPKNNYLSQSDITSCASVCIANLENALNNEPLTKNPELGIIKDANNNLKCKDGATLLRKDQLNKLKALQVNEELANEFMGKTDSISPADLVEAIFNSEHNPEAKSVMLNSLLDAGMIEGQKILSKKDVIKALHNPSKKQNIDRSNFERGASSGNLHPGHLPNNTKNRTDGRNI